jgi:hypothetical protein
MASLYHEFTQVTGALALGRQGAQRLEAAKADLSALATNPIDANRAARIGRECATAYADFTQVQAVLRSVPGVVRLDAQYRDELDGAARLIPVAIDVSHAGVIASQAATLLIARLRHPLDPGQKGITPADLASLRGDASQIVTAINDALLQVGQLQPRQVQALQTQSPRLGRELAKLRQGIPALRGDLDDVRTLLDMAPTLLGIGSPTSYLVEVMDSTELRPGGGFIGNYGIATVSGGLLTSAKITDTYLLDWPFEVAGGYIAIPAPYRWFNIAPDWGLRDSNLNADFPTSARNAEAIYQREDGTAHVQGVFAITPWFIQSLLAITGPVRVAEYGDTVTAQNLVDRIHYYQLGPGHGDSTVAATDVSSSTRKRFTALLAQDLLAKVRALPPSSIGHLVKAVQAALHSKDAQVYFNAGPAEALLAKHGLASTIQATAGDGLLVVDANITATKANYFLTNTLQDQVTLDARGDALHHTTITSAWTRPSPAYYGNPIYGDYLQVYAPPGSSLLSQKGWQPRGAFPEHGRQVWAGYIQLTFGASRSITLTWQAPNVALHDRSGWHYRIAIQRQPGQLRQLDEQLTLPACSGASPKWIGLHATQTRLAALAAPLTTDVTLGADFTCTP